MPRGEHKNSPFFLTDQDRRNADQAGLANAAKSKPKLRRIS